MLKFIFRNRFSYGDMVIIGATAYLWSHNHQVIAYIVFVVGIIISGLIESELDNE